MATTLTKHLLSQSEAISGRRFLLTSREASAADVFHVVPSNSNIVDELWVYAHNYGSTDVKITFMWGLSAYPAATLSAADVSEGTTITIPFQSGRALVFDGALMMHSLSAAAYADTVNVITLDGFVNRLTTS